MRSTCLGLAMTLAAAVAAWQPTLEISAAGARKGPWRQNASRYDYVDDATLAFAPGGGQFVAWADQKSRDVWLRVAARDGRLGPPLNVARSPATFSWAPRLAVDPRRPRQVYLLWQEIVFSGGTHGGDILFARSTDGGASFGAPRPVAGGPGTGRQPYGNFTYFKYIDHRE